MTEAITARGSLRALLAAIATVMLVTGLRLAVAQSAPAASAEIWAAPARAARKENPIAAEAKSIAQGKELFVGGCLPCHGAAGKGDGPAAPSLERDGKPVRPGDLSNPKLREQTDGTLFWKISEGRTPMPAFAESFTEEQRWQIINYVRTLALPANSNSSAQPGNKP